MLEEIINQYPSKAAFCRAIDIKPQFLSQIESGDRPWPPSAVLALKKLHGVNPTDLRPDIYPPEDAPDTVVSARSRTGKERRHDARRDGQRRTPDPAAAE